jgi:hypothetical protein
VPRRSYGVDSDGSNREFSMYPATLDHVAAYQSEHRRRAGIHNAMISAAAPNEGSSRSRWFVRRVTAKRLVPADS